MYKLYISFVILTSVVLLASLAFLLFKRKVRKQSEKSAELHKASIYKYVKQNAGKKEFRLTENQWEALGGAIDQAYDGFTDRIMEQSAVSELEMHVCYLTKIEISPTSMAELLCKSKSAITMLRSRLYRKLSGREGTAQQFDHWIMEL